MKINLTNINSYAAHNTVLKAKKNASFNGCLDSYVDETSKGRAIKNYSYLFRNNNVLNYLPKYLNKKYPKGAPIYCYACSNGADPYSFIMNMTKNLDKKDMDKFLPIEAIDKSEKIIEKAKSKEIVLGKNELIEFLKLKSKDKFLKDTGKTAEYEHFGLSKTFKVQNKLYKNVNFKTGDLVKDSINKTFEKPCVLMFKNAWQFFDVEPRKKLAESLFEALKPDSTVVIGDQDFRVGADYYLRKAGFKQKAETEPSCYIFTKPTKK